MDGELNLLEKAMIDLRAREDVKRKSVERIVFMERGVVMRKAVPDDADPNALPSSLYSPFVTGELSRFNSARDHRLGGKKVQFWLYNDHFRKVMQRTAFPQAISKIDSQVTLYKVKLNLLADRYSEKLADHDRQRKHYEQTEEMHMVQMCVNQARKVRADYASVTNPYYTGIVELLGQKAELLALMNGKIMDRRARCYRRIRHYMERVVTYRPALGPENMPDEVLGKFADTSILGDYESVQEETLRQQTHYNDELNAVQNW